MDLNPEYVRWVITARDQGFKFMDFDYEVGITFWRKIIIKTSFSIFAIVYKFWLSREALLTILNTCTGISHYSSEVKWKSTVRKVQIREWRVTFLNRIFFSNWREWSVCHAGLKRNGMFQSVVSISRTDGANYSVFDLTRRGSRTVCGFRCGYMYINSFDAIRIVLHCIVIKNGFWVAQIERPFIVVRNLLTSIQRFVSFSIWNENNRYI